MLINIFHSAQRDGSENMGLTHKIIKIFEFHTQVYMIIIIIFIRTYTFVSAALKINGAFTKSKTKGYRT